MKINSVSVIFILIISLFIIVGIIFYLRISKFNKIVDTECEEEHIINNKQKACCVQGKCKIKDI